MKTTSIFFFNFLDIFRLPLFSMKTRFVNKFVIEGFFTQRHTSRNWKKKYASKITNFGDESGICRSHSQK